ncbi:hypothetical protein F4778DRAFT_779289 [Xylariomycetidae sp. FL2044]|nr:hypothetical protein F4778DRAFT_779289 [Xylariomycetidae sp. FL2044]
MPDSNKATYNGDTPAKPTHYFSSQIPTSDTQAYRLESFTNSPDSTLRASDRTSRDIEASHDTTSACNKSVGHNNFIELSDASIEASLWGYLARRNHHTAMGQKL